MVEPIKILIVEDNETLSDMYRMKFERAGHVVKVCANGLDAVTDVTGFLPDVILLDIMMPSMDGFETLKTIRHLAPSLKMKIFMFSNLNGREDIDKCMQYGANGYLVKANTTPKEALIKIEEALGRPLSGASIPIGLTKKPLAASSDGEHLLTACPHCGKHISVHVALVKEEGEEV